MTKKNTNKKPTQKTQKPSAKKNNGKLPPTCSACGKSGHNIRTCGNKP